MTVMPRTPSRKSKRRRSSFVPPASRASLVPDALSWRNQLDGNVAPKGPAAWTAASSIDSGRTVVDAGPYGVIELALETRADELTARRQLGVVWWDKRSFREEDDDEGTIETSFVPAPITNHVSMSAPVQRATGGRGLPQWDSIIRGVAGAEIIAPPGRARERGRASAVAGATPAAAAVAGATPAAPVAAAPAAPSTATAAPSVSPLQPRDTEPVLPAPRGARKHISQPSKEDAAPGPKGRPTRRVSLQERKHARRSRHIELVPASRRHRTARVDTTHPRRSRLRRRRTRRRILLGVLLLLAAFVATIIIQSAIITPFTVPSVSMENALHPGDRILVNKAAYGTSSLHRGDVVVFTDPGGWLTGPRTAGGAKDDYLVKRVIGIPGDHVSCCSTDGRVTVNGRELFEQYALPTADGKAATTFDVRVPAGALWVLGDNRKNSRDSSQTQELPTKGFVPIADVVGQAFLTAWPLNRLSPIGTAQETFAFVPNPS